MTDRTSPPAAFSPIGRKEEPFDPLRLCVYTTIALLAWLLTPALVVSIFSGVALIAYFKARREGLVRSRCRLGDTRLVMTYLALVFVSGVAYTIYRITGLF